MVHPSVIVVLVFLVLLQATLTTGWFSGPRRCSYPGRRYSGSYFYGSTSLQSSGKKRKRAIVSTWELKHSLLLFRGKIFEWGLGSPKTYKMDRNPTDCAITWNSYRSGWSGCRLSDVENWTRGYRRRRGSYNLFSNNCHHFVNRLGSYLSTNCGR